MDQCQIDGIDEIKTPHDVHHETNMKSTKHISIKKNTTESDHRTSKRKNDISNSNTLKKKKKYETALAAIFPENDQSYSQYAQDYAEGFMKKMRDRLDIESFDMAIKLLASFGDADDSNINQLYQKITEVFTNKNEDLRYEFLGFLLPGQALLIGRFTDYLELTRIKEFIRKLQVCMKKQPTQVRKILDNLFQLSKSENITPLEVHNAMLPLLKSNPILVDCFFQLIPTEHPPESFFSDGNWEDLDIDQSINCGIDYEEIIPSDSEEHTLLNTCHCMCHKPGINTHCRSCGLKFFKGRIYFDTPEGLKLAKINFDGADSFLVQSKIDKTKENVTIKQKNRKGLIKNSSPGSAEDIKGSTGTESEEDLIDVKPKKRQKSKVVQSLKLKFKKEESPKCKDDQELSNETGKSIVHVTNEELNSSEMVFFCIPKVDSSIKNLPKKKLNTKDTKENNTQKEIEIINQTNTETYGFNRFNPIVLEKNNVITTNDFIFINNSNSISKEINFIPPTVSIDNVQELDYKCEQSEISNKIEVVLNNQSLSNKKKNSENCNLVNMVSNMDKIKSDESNVGAIKTEFIHDFSETSNMHKNSSDESNVHAIKIDLVHDLSEDNKTTGNMHKNSSDELDVHAIKTEVILDSDTIKNEKMCNFQSVSTKLITDDNCSATDANEILLDENITTKSEAENNLPKCYADVSKRNNNESEKPLINEWTIDEDKIILQTCKRVEDIEVLLETINRRIPQRSVSEIQERFTTLMTLLEQMIDVKQN